MFYEATNLLKQLPQSHFYLSPECVELPFLASVFTCLRAQIPESLWHRYEWVFLYPHTPLDRVISIGKSHIVVYIGNEKGHIPAFFQQAAYVFTPYLDFAYAYQNVHVIPLGCNGHLSALSVLTMSQRDLLFSFVGQVLSERLAFMAEGLNFLGRIKPCDEFKAYLTFTPRFQSGLSPGTYADILHRSCFAPVPPGISPITFRLFEALRAGCVVVTGPLPPYPYLRELPALRVADDWKAFAPKVLTAFKDPGRMQQLQRESLAYYQRVCSAEGVARQIASTIIRSGPSEV